MNNKNLKNLRADDLSNVAGGKYVHHTTRDVCGVTYYFSSSGSCPMCGDSPIEFNSTPKTTIIWGEHFSYGKCINCNCKVIIPN